MKRFLVIAVFSLFLVSCTSKPDKHVDQLNSNFDSIQGRAGFIEELLAQISIPEAVQKMVTNQLVALKKDASNSKQELKNYQGYNEKIQADLDWYHNDRWVNIALFIKRTWWIIVAVLAAWKISEFVGGFSTLGIFKSLFLKLPFVSKLFGR